MTHIGQRLHGVQGALPTINCVVSNLNLEELPDMVRFSRRTSASQSASCRSSCCPTRKRAFQNWEARFIRYRPEMGVCTRRTPPTRCKRAHRPRLRRTHPDEGRGLADPELHAVP